MDAIVSQAGHRVKPGRRRTVHISTLFFRHGERYDGTILEDFCMTEGFSTGITAEGAEAS
jgi:hypothetical protein